MIDAILCLMWITLKEQSSGQPVWLNMKNNEHDEWCLKLVCLDMATE